MIYEPIYFLKYNMLSANEEAKTAFADWLLFADDDAVVAMDAIAQIKKAVDSAADNVVAFELRQSPVDSAHHIDPVTLEIAYLDTAAFLVKRSAFERAGGFDSNFSVLSLLDLSWRLRSMGGVLKSCPQAVVTSEIAHDERYEYIHGAYEKLLLGYKWGNETVAKAEFEQTLKAPRHFDGVRKELLKLYVQHFFKIGSLKKFRKTRLYNRSVCDFSPGFGPSRGKEAFAEINNEPLVSVVVRTHKRKEVLRRTLMCLRNQIYRNFEVVIVEDGENTAEEMVKTDFADLNINYYATGKNVGRGRAGNIGIERAKGEFVSFLDDDDYYYPDHISSFVAFFEKNPQAYLAVSGGMAYKTNVLSVDPYEFTVEETYPILFDHITLMDMCVRCRVPMPCGMFRRNMYDRFGGMHEAIGGDEDWYMWLKYMAWGQRTNKYNDDIHRALSLFGYPADEASARKREEDYRVFDEIMLSDEKLVFDVHGSEIQKWEEYVFADITHLKNIGHLSRFMDNLKPLGIEKLEYNPQEINRISAKQINNYYYWLVNHYTQQ